MIPVILKIKGIYSYKEEQTIDFQKLTKSGLFGIFGSVGSGKSTILEAISFALFGETERMNKNDCRAYNMMNLKSNELFIDFIFTCNDLKYSFVVSGKRNKKDFSKVEINRTAYRIDGDERIPIEDKSADKIIGLNYENFRRTIIIPQGKFQEFLQLGDKDRTTMLKQLFNLDKFELSDKVKMLEDINTKEIDNREGQLIQIGQVSDEIIKEKTALIESLTLDIVNDEKILTERELLNKQYESIRELYIELAKQKKELEALEVLKDSYRQRELLLNEFQQCLVNFKNPIENNKAKKKELENNTLLLTKCNSTIIELNKSIGELRVKFEAIRRDYDNRNLIKAEAEEYEIVKKIKSLTSDIAEIKSRIIKGESIVIDTGKVFKDLQEKEEAISELIINLKKDKPDIKLLSDMKSWFQIRNSIEDNSTRYQKEIAKIKIEIDNLNNDKQTIINNADIVKNNGYDLLSISSDEIESKLKKLIEINEKEIAGLDEKIEQLMLHKKLSDFADNLINGQACPLCGAKEHPLPYSSNDSNIELTASRKSRTEKTENIKKINELARQISLINNKLQINSRTYSEKQNEKSNNDNLLSEHLTKYIWIDYKDINEETVTKRIEEAGKIEKEIDIKEKERATIQTKLRDKTKDKEKYTEVLNKLRNENISKESEIKVISEGLKHLDLPIARQLDASEIDTVIKDLNKKYLETEKNYKDCESQLNLAQEQLNQNIGQQNELGKNIEILKPQIESLESEIRNKLAEYQYDSIKKVESVLNKDINTGREKIEIDEFREKYQTAKLRVSETEKSIAGNEYNEEQHKQLISEINNQKADLSVKKEKVGGLKSENKKLNTDLANKRNLEKELLSLRNRQENIETLKKMFKGSGFVNFISTRYLENLCLAANDRFCKLTKNKLSLEINDQNNFQIRDALNDGKIRSVKTLSGGQTFQASLSLALALADNIQHLNRNNSNFFFMDEGFGSLDKESLSVVFDTFNSLRRENRIVGIISHVEDLKEAIDNYITIVNDESKGSIINNLLF
ncbi:MAG: SMC family ATPase [Bacteroidota bacterium]|nr:SMC family ATPase [Bacteroidota bacterium]